MNKNDCKIRLETPEDYYETETLTRNAFWNLYRPGCSEHYVLHSYRGRDDFVKELDFVMEKDGRIIGHVMYVRTTLQADDGRNIPIMTFGPISIEPAYQRKGYGKALLDYSLDKAKALGTGAVCIEGDIGFYGKSGFVIASTKGINYYAEPRDALVPYFLLKELKDGFFDGVTGVYRTPAGYFVDGNEVESFDSRFPAKEKKVLPGQLG